MDHRNVGIGVSSLVGLLAGLLALGSPAPASAADVPDSVVELQQYRQTASQPITARDGREGVASLTDLNPRVGVWYLLELRFADRPVEHYHLETASTKPHSLILDPGFRDGLLIAEDAERRRCPLWAADELARAARANLPYVSLCEGRLFLRNPVRGRQTRLEAVVDLVRDHLWGGEGLIDLAKDTVFKDAELERARTSSTDTPATASAEGPRPADLQPPFENRLIDSGNLGIAVDGPRPGQLGIGQWYRARDIDGVHLSLIEPQAVAAGILSGFRDRVAGLDEVERSALVYLVAFDLERFSLGFSMGTQHPRVDWSARPPASVRDAALPGPDGIADLKPLVMTGMVSPRDTASTVATFTGGFKRYHGAFRYGDLATRNHGSHYGFIEEEVVLSALQPGLATLAVSIDGRVRMQTWRDADPLLGRLRYARQNGVPLVEWDETGKRPVPGALVNRWGPGNWSGSAEGALRTVRAGACLQQSAQGRFLLYGYFSSATPSAMTRVFQAYGCEYAMLLDMNALIHTYLAVYPRISGRVQVQHLVRGMAEVDQTLNGEVIPRFLGVPDNRDFFFLTRRQPTEGGQ
ncbi:MAG: hypothetical protein KDK91_05355 [Gammaproteobacteria bacterium]|nr:hypothetical protein [Gammaproteobacteria bacterium]